MLPAVRIKELLHQANFASGDEPLEAQSQYESEVEWLLVSKATTQTYGLVLNTLLDQIIPLSHDIWYWDQILTSYTYSTFYAVQTSPLRWWAWSKDIYRESKLRSTLSRKTNVSSQSPQAESDGLLSQ